MNKIKIILNYIFGFLLSISLSIIVILLILKSSLFSKEYIKNEINKANYYTNIYQTIIEGMQDYIGPSGFPNTILEGIITEEKVKIEIDNFVESVIDGKQYTVNVDGISDTLKKNIKNYLKNYNVAIEENDDLNKFISDIENVYINEIKLYKVLDHFVGIYPKMNNYVNRGLILSSILSIVLIVLLLINKSRVLISSIIGSGIILILSKLFIFSDIDINNITIFNDYISVALRNIINYLSNIIMYFGIGFIAFGIIISIFILILISKRK